MVNKFRASVLTAVMLSMPPSVSCQSPAPPTYMATAPGLVKLTGLDERRADELDESIEAADKADRLTKQLRRKATLVRLGWNVGARKRNQDRQSDGAARTLIMRALPDVVRRRR
jgi:hypothetical protein